MFADFQTIVLLSVDQRNFSLRVPDKTRIYGNRLHRGQTILVCNQPPKSTEPDCPYMGRHSEYQRKLWSKQTHTTSGVCMISKSELCLETVVITVLWVYMAQ